jgi:predicted RNA-binding protein with PUA-like domain
MPFSFWGPPLLSFSSLISIMRYWLMKSEPDEASIDDLANAPERTLPWTGVRNYQARNFMRDTMQVGDGVLFYHSSCPEPGIAGLAEVVSAAYPDPTQFDPKNPYYDPKSTRETPRWMLVDVRFVKKTPLISLAALREHPELAGMRVLAKGNRLSITPVTDAEWRFISKQLA